MGLHLLNCSVDMPDRYVNSIPENLTVNKQETITEIIIEKLLGFENAIAEIEDNDAQQQATLKKTAQTDHFILPDTTCNGNLQLIAVTVYPIALNNNIPVLFFDVEGPPPRC